jgi:hypothetical protein
MAAKKRVDPIKQREKRAKIAAIVGCVLFLGVGAIEVPSVMKELNKKPPPGTTYDPGPSGGSALPNVAGSSPTGLSSSGDLADTDVPPQANEGELVSFAVFETKNPFTPQVESEPTPPDPTGAPTVATPDAGSSKSGADVPSHTTTTPAGQTVLPAGGTTTTPTTTTTTPTSTTPALPPTVSISVNGVTSHVGSGGTFPSTTPVFRLVSCDSGSAQIGIVGGSYSDGGAALTLKLNVPVTLENTTDGKRYTLVLTSIPKKA